MEASNAKMTDKPWIKKYPALTNPEIDINSYETLVQIIHESCNKFPNHTAYTNMGQNLTYKEIDELSDQFASFLQHELKLKKGDRIAIQMPNLLQFPIALFGSMKAGLIIVNTNPLYTAKEMNYQFKDSGAKAIIILANYAHSLEQIIRDTSIESVVITEVGDLLPLPKRWIVNSVVKFVKKLVPKFNIPQHYTFNQALQLGAIRKPLSIDLGHNDISFLQYTGGTTGVSKGAILTHRCVIANMLQICEIMRPAVKEGSEIIVTALPMYHIFSLTVNCMTFMKYGAQNILITNPRDIGAFLSEIKKYKFTVMTGVNTLFNALMNHADFKPEFFSHLKLSVAGAMALQNHVANKWQDLTNSPILEGYGLTEASPVVCCNPTDLTHRVGTIGLPAPSTDIKLVDESGAEVKIGEPGELICKGPQLMQGYWEKPEETSKVIKDGWLYTGDIAVMDPDGFFKIVDRKKDMILISGFNVYPNEVEEAIASHSGVLEVAAIGVPDERSGEAVKVFIVKKDPNLTVESVLDHARLSLTSYKVPKFVEFRNELPKTNVGKILRRALRESK